MFKPPLDIREGAQTTYSEVMTELMQAANCLWKVLHPDRVWKNFHPAVRS